jgi:pimeloyl-ACP methyl ester carboxylesterase
MQKVNLDEVELAYHERGSGELLVLIHGGVLADGFHPIFADPDLARENRMILYHRRGYGGSSRVEPPFSTSRQAADGQALVRHLGFPRVHLAGHSYGAAIALQWAFDAPDTVASLVLLEPPLFFAIPAGPDFWNFIDDLTRTFESGDYASAMDSLLRGVVGPDYLRGIDRTLPPGALDAALADLATLFLVELPELRRWRFTEEDLRRLRMPVLLVTGGQAGTIFRQSHQLFREWLPSAEEIVVPTTHGLQYEAPSAVARGIVDFLARTRVP